MESKDERRGALTLVPTKPATNITDDVLAAEVAKSRKDAIREMERGNGDKADLRRRYPLIKQEIAGLIVTHCKNPILVPRRRRATLEKPDDTYRDAPSKKQPPPDPTYRDAPSKYAPTYAGRVVGGCFILLGLVGAGVGGWINCQFGLEAAGVPGALIGVVVDGGAMLFMVAAWELWRLRSFLCVVAFVLWFFFVAGSTYAALNYTGVRLGDYFQSRDDVAAQRGDLASQIRRVEAQRAAIKEEGNAKVLENRVATELTIEPRCARKSNLGTYYCDTYNKLKDAWTNADARDKLDTTLTELHRQLDAKQAVASKNPAAEQVAEMSEAAGHRITAEQAASYWLRWLAMVPGLAGLMLTIGAALVGKRS
jgi:hypothetical protein